MRVLVTGATGLIGHHVCRQLLSSGHQLTVVTRSKSKYDEIVGLPAYVLEHESYERTSCYLSYIRIY